ncbi:MAG: hypothetical protein JKY94_02390 [Rhodobacteraceae bacterium]|nr:hypothetical protein [Paracoccaceae bacterium]
MTLTFADTIRPKRGNVDRAIDVVFGESLDFSSIGGSILSHYSSKVSGVSYQFVRMPDNVGGSNGQGTPNGIDVISLNSSLFGSSVGVFDRMANQKLLVQTVMHEALHESHLVDAKSAAVYSKLNLTGFTRCSIPDDHIDPRRSAFFMAVSVLRDIRERVQC